MTAPPCSPTSTARGRGTAITSADMGVPSTWTICLTGSLVTHDSASAHPSGPVASAVTMPNAAGWPRWG